MDESSIITTSVNLYNEVFIGFYSKIVQWGQWLFAAIFGLSMSWSCLLYAMDRKSFDDSMADFLKELATVSLFFILMTNAVSLFGDVIITATQMGESLTGIMVDPSSILGNGIALGNLIIAPVKESSFIFGGLGLVLVSIAYIAVIAVFIRVSIDLAVTIIYTHYLIAMSGLLLAFSASPMTRVIARKTIDSILANAVKLLSVYSVVAAGNFIFGKVAGFLPKDDIVSFDIYIVSITCAGMFYLLATFIPSKIAAIISDSIQEIRGADAVGAAITAMKIANQATNVAAPVIANTLGNAAKISGSVANNAAAHAGTTLSQGGSVGGAMSAAAAGASKDFASALGGSISDKFKHLADKLSGGKGIAGTDHAGNSNSPPGVAQRMYSASKNLRNSSSQKQ